MRKELMTDSAPDFAYDFCRSNVHSPWVASTLPGGNQSISVLIFRWSWHVLH